MIVCINALLNFSCGVTSMDPVSVVMDQEIKKDGNGYPNQGPAQGFPERQGMVFFLEKSQVNPKHEKDKKEEGRKEDGFVDIRHISSRTRRLSHQSYKKFLLLVTFNRNRTSRT